MYINISGKLNNHPLNSSINIDKNNSCYNRNDNNTDLPKNISISDGSLSVSPTSVSPTRIFPEDDFVFNHSSSFFNTNADKDALQTSPSKDVLCCNNAINNTKTASTIKIETYNCSNRNIFHKNNSISSLGFISRPKRINEFSQRSKDDDLIKLNTERNRYIPSRSKSLPFNSLKLKSNLKSSNGEKGRPVRSKSVHFDELLPIKYFHKYECPTCVSRENNDCEVIEKINFDIVKPLRRYQSDSDSNGDDNNGNNNTDNTVTFIKEDGLFDINFSILSQTSNNRDLKLNVYVNSGSDSNIMLQSIKLEKRRTYNNFFDFFIWGKISVKNIFYEKSIYIRYTFNHWKTFNEIKAQYVQDMLLKSNFKDYDTFEFSLYNLKNLILNGSSNSPVLASSSNEGSNIIEGDLEFCIHYETVDSNTNKILDFWDNNNGKNYKIHLVLHTQDDNNNNNNKNLSMNVSTDLHSNKSKNKNDDDNDDDDGYFMFQTDKYYNIANELGGFNKKNNKFGEYKNSSIFSSNRTRTNSTFLDDLLNETNFLQLDDYSSMDSTTPTSKLYNFNNYKNNNLLLQKNNTNKIFGNSNDEDCADDVDKDDDRPLFFKDFRNPFAN